LNEITAMRLKLKRESVIIVMLKMHETANIHKLFWNLMPQKMITTENETY